MPSQHQMTRGDYLWDTLRAASLRLCPTHGSLGAVKSSPGVCSGAARTHVVSESPVGVAQLPPRRAAPCSWVTMPAVFDGSLSPATCPGAVG